MDDLKVGLAQIAPVWMMREPTLAKVANQISEAADRGCGLVVFGEALAPGYPFWLQHTGGAKFNDHDQKTMHAHYLEQAVDIERGDLEVIQKLCAQRNIAVTLGAVERPSDRGSHSLYCSLVQIGDDGKIRSVHRKLQPTHEERLVWSPGDGHGLQVHDQSGFKMGGLNCWENWMPLARSALYAQGENLHLALWPGSPRNT
ncbi:MAG: nitrilase, partial [Candidatus Krumholzibacteriia bacterium]